MQRHGKLGLEQPHLGYSLSFVLPSCLLLHEVKVFPQGVQGCHLEMYPCSMGFCCVFACASLVLS